MNDFLSPREFAEAVGASESSLKRWADDGLIKVHRTAGGHRRIALAEALRYIRDAGLPLVKPEILGFGVLWKASKPSTESEADAALKQAVKEGFSDLARQLVLSSYLGGRRIAEVCDRPLATAMHEVGELWKHTPEGIFIEHRALDVCIAALDYLRGLLPPLADDAPVAVGGALEGDPYVLPSLMVATVLAVAGWRTFNLGANLPVDSLLLAAKRHKPQVVWLSCSVTDAATARRGDVRRAGATLAGDGLALLVGGRAWRDVRVEGNGITMVGSMAEVEAFAEGLRSAAA